MSTRHVETPDGRTLRVHEGGDPSGAIVVYQHGTPSDGRLYEPWVDDAKRRGIRLVGYDRPGYGGSTRHPGRKVADAARDVETVVGALDGGVDGWLDDDLAFVDDWGFAPGPLHAPTLLLQGEHDLMVPPAHFRWLADHLPNVEARFDPGEGHLTLYERVVPAVHEWLVRFF